MTTAPGPEASSHRGVVSAATARSLFRVSGAAEFLGLLR